MSMYLITGANRGIGLELTRQVLAEGHQVLATCRNPENADELKALAGDGDLQVAQCDIGQPEDISRLVATVGGKAVDVLINNAGIYGPRDAVLGNLSREPWREVMAIDLIAPMMLTQALLPNIQAGNDKRIAFLSSKMGSIADNSSGGSYMYRTAKAALNQAIKSLAVDLQEQGIIALSLHPGWVRTEMGGPNGLIDTETSARGLLNVISGATASDSGEFIAYDGKRIPW